MRLTKSAPPKSNDDHLIPLINVVFLLLIFFMVIGHIAPTDLFAVTPPASTSESDLEPAEITLLISADGQLAVDGERVSAEALTDVITRRMSDARAADSTAPLPSITVKADAGLRAERLGLALNALRTAGTDKVTLLTARSN